MKTEIYDFIEDFIVQNGTSVISYNLTTRELNVEILNKEHTSVINLLKNNFVNSLIENNIVADGCVGAVKEFAQKIETGVQNDQCYALIRNDNRASFQWFYFTYKFLCKDKDLVMVIRSVNSDVDKKLFNSLFNKQIVSGVANGNSYFIINIDDGFILNSYGKLAIKTTDYKEQINYIASMCGDLSQKFRATLSKENLQKYTVKNTECDLLTISIKDIDDVPKWFRVTAACVKHPISGKNFVLITFADIDAKYKELQNIKYNATHDELTDVYNKNAFKEKAIECIAKLSADFWRALVFVDIDNFKGINDAFGHVIGDRVLRGVASGIKNSFRKNDVIGRVGGDEFMILFSVPTLYDLKNKLHMLDASIKQGSQIENISVSIGVVIFGDKDTDFSKLYYLSDKAMYNAKKLGKNRYHVIDQHTNSFLNDVMRKMSDVEMAQIMKLKVNNYIFCHLTDEKVFVDYVTQQLVDDVFEGKNILTLDNISEFLSKSDVAKINKLVKEAQTVQGILKDTIKIKGNNYQIFVSNSNFGTVIGLQDE